jgi:hypothetical protein
MAGSAFFVSAEPSTQNRKATLRCTAVALRALKPLPKLEYECAERDEDNLKTPERKAALREQMKQLEGFTSTAWWAANVEELNVCAALNEPTTISRDKYIAEAYPVTIFGDAQTRLVITDDPCIKYSYGTLNAFVLQRASDKVVVTQVLDAYFSRAYNAVSMKIVDRGAQRTLDVSAGSGGLHPHTDYFQFTMDAKTHRAVAVKGRMRRP